MNEPDARQVATGYWVERIRFVPGSPRILGYQVSRRMPEGWTAPMHVGTAKTAAGARRLIREHQVREAAVSRLTAAARRLELGPDLDAATLIDASGGLLLRADEPIRLSDPLA